MAIKKNNYTFRPKLMARVTAAALTLFAGTSDLKVSSFTPCRNLSIMDRGPLK